MQLNKNPYVQQASKYIPVNNICTSPHSKICLQASKIAHWVKVLATELEDMSLTHGSQMVEEKQPPDLYIPAVVHTQIKGKHKSTFMTYYPIL